jgi:hypothetical protein
MKPRQPVELDFNGRCQFQLKHHWLGKNEKSTKDLSPLLIMSWGFFVAPNVLPASCRKDELELRRDVGSS